MEVFKCDLCEAQTILKILQNPTYLDVLSFLKGSDNKFSEALLCSTCGEKVALVNRVKKGSKTIVSKDLDGQTECGKNLNLENGTYF